MPFYGTIDLYNKSHKVQKVLGGLGFMESLVTVFMVVSVMVLSVYLAYYLRDTETKHQKMNDVFTFCLPCIATTLIGLAVISDIMFLPIIITAALLAGTLSLLVIWTTEEKEKQAKEKRNALNYIVFIIMRNNTMSLESKYGTL